MIEIFASAALSHYKDRPTSKSLYQSIIGMSFSYSLSYAIHVLLPDLHRLRLQEPIDSCRARRCGQ